MASTTADHTAQFQEPPVATIPPSKPLNTTDEDYSAQFQEPISPHASTSANSDPSTHKSTASKVKDAIKKPFVKEKENPPELQAAINVMEDRKDETARKMEAEGKDSSVLSGKRKDIVK